MIGPEDAEFHAVPSEHRETWAESNYFPFWIPEAGLSGAAYSIFRPGLGVCMSDVTIFDRCAGHWEGLAYTDNQQHIPCPPSLASYALRNGLRVEALDPPRDYRIDYVGIDDTEMHFDFRGQMRPQDFNDPDQDPLAKSGTGGAWDKAFDGHFDMTGRVRGELILRGKRHPIDCLSTMDRSWGPRAERNNGSAVFVQAHFGEDLSINGLFALDPSAIDRFGPILHGYVMDGTDVRALVSGQGSTIRQGMKPQRFDIDVQDVAGTSYKLSGRFKTWAPWAPYTSVIYYQGMAEWQFNGRTGYGAYQEVLGRATIARHGLAHQERGT